MFDIFKKKRKIIVDETDVTKVLFVINSYLDVTYDQGIIVDWCAWDDRPDKWFILLWTNNKDWASIVEDIKHIKSALVE